MFFWKNLKILTNSNLIENIDISKHFYLFIYMAIKHNTKNIKFKFFIEI